ncbi:MAG TPA: response regulator [Thermoanaerobaculia bacterium]|jgi:CheY-like chemotaxis protein
MGHKILLADDSITIQKVIELTFSDEDFELHTVGNGQKAIDEIRSIMPHIVLCDIIMPEKNGYEVCEFIKSSPDLKHVPVLLLTGAFEPFDQERARSAGCDGFLAKPFEPQTLISKVKELLVKSPAAAAAPAPAPAAAKPYPGPAASGPRPDDDRTVMMPPAPGVASPAPARPPHVAAAPAPPPAPVAEYGSGFDDAFAIEAGERELMMEPGDHTVLLGGREAHSAAPASVSADDIWGAVDTGPAAPEEEDSSTVFMAPPPAAAPPPAPVQAFASPEYEVQYEPDDLDATWRMPNESAAAAAPPRYQGFEEFTDPPLQPLHEATSYVPPPPVPEPPPPVAAAPPPLEMPPPLTPSAPEPVFEPYDPFVAAAQHSAAGFEPVSPFDSDQTLDSAVTGADDTFERIATGGFDAYGEPEILSQTQAPAPVQPEPEPLFETNSTHEPFDEIEVPVTSSTTEPVEAGFAARPAPSAADGGGREVSLPAMPAIDEALLDKLAARVVDKLSQKIIQEIAWEVVPDLAEGMIQREIDALKAKLAKVPK